MRAIPLFIVFLYSYLGVVQTAVSQTLFQGKVLTIDGRTIPKTMISIRPEVRQDIFSDHYENIIPEDDGSYQFQINEPGLYTISFSGVFHGGVSFPIMVYDQPSMTINILLMPMIFNDGFYFERGQYLDWIRVIGNFNDYDYNTGEKFSLNPDGSIRAFIPVNSDTIRYQVRGLTYGRGSAVLPKADEFQVRENGSFESVLYNNLPNDSLEIRYDPVRSIPFKRNLPDGMNPQEIALEGLISLRNQENQNWIWPLGLLQFYSWRYHFVEWEMSNGIPVETQKEIQKKFTGGIFETDLREELEQVKTELSKDNLHPQQRALLSICYASVLGWTNRKTLLQQMRSKDNLQKKNQSEEQITKVESDMDILMSIPETIPFLHPAWRYANGAVDYLLTESEDPQKFRKYFYQVIQNHPDERTVRSIAMSIIRHFGTEYSSVGEMPVYQVIVERFGENDIARDAHRTFRSQITN